MDNQEYQPVTDPNYLALLEAERRAYRTADEIMRYYPGDGTQAQQTRFDEIRAAGRKFVATLLLHGTPGPDLTHAIREARSAQQWAIASIVVPNVPLPRS